MKLSLATLLNLSILSVAHPSAEATAQCTPSRTTYTAQYDDLPFTEPGPNPVPPHYYGLSYTTFQVDQYDFFIPPTSGNQWAMAFGGSGNISIPDSYVEVSCLSVSPPSFPPLT